MPKLHFRRPVTALLALLLLSNTPSNAADADHPAVIELFQSQGCSSCPPANANLNALAGRPDILALSFSVTYWDRLGWKDIFAKPAFTQRQWDYARAGRRSNVFTPQMIVNGRGVLIGHRRDQIEQFLLRYDRGASGPRIGLEARRISLGKGAIQRPANVWLVRYDPRAQNVAVRAGENSGRTLPHRNVVRSIQLLGKWTGAPASFAVPATPQSYRSAVLVQDGPGGAILSARRI